MRLKLKSNFDLGRDSLEIVDREITLRFVLKELAQGQRGGFSLIDSRTGDVDEAFRVYINSQEYKNLPHRLETLLSNGDCVSVEVVVLGGG